MEKNGKTLLSEIDPVRRAEKTADAVSVTDRTLYFCPSPIYGYGLSRILSRLETEAPSSAVLCVEADPELFNISLNNIDPLILSNNKFRITNIQNGESLYSFFDKAWGAMSFRKIETVKFTGGYQLFPELYASLCDTLRREIAANWSNALTLAKLGRLYIRNFLRNIASLTSFSFLEDLSFGSSPVLVLGAGPSLDDTLDALQKAINREKPVRDCFKIICVDTCLGALKDRGIIPDLTVILESQHWNIFDFTGNSGWKIPAAVDLSSLPSSANLLTGSGFLFFTPWTYLRIFERLKKSNLLPKVVSPLGSVGLTAVEIARRLTSGKIICAGIDFSFTADKYHARGTPGHRRRLNSQTRFKRLFNTTAFEESTITAVSKSGINVHTSPIMKKYRDLFEQEFGGDPRVFDIECAGSFAAGTGLPLGVKTLSIDEFKKEFDHEPSRTRTNLNCAVEDQVRVKTEGFISGKKENINVFYENEKKLLTELRGILTGEIKAEQGHLEELISECDYLWAHFPDCAGRNQDSHKNFIAEKSFLKRVRAEIDPMLKLISHVI